MARFFSAIIMYASVKHAIWAGLLAFYPEAGRATPVSGVLTLPFDRLAVCAFLFMASALALKVVYHEPAGSTHSAILLLPQFTIICLAAFAAGAAILHGHYADGVMRPRAFIAADQIHPITLLLFHQLAFGAYLQPLAEKVTKWRV